MTAGQAVTSPIGSRDCRPLTWAPCVRNGGGFIAPSRRDLSRDLIMRALAYRIQEIAFGGLAKATLRRLATLAAEFESDGQIAAHAQPRIKPGARLVREWHGRTHAVVVTEDGFEFEGNSVDR